MTENSNTRAALPDAVVTWVERAKKTPLLTEDEEKNLGRRIAQDDEDAFQKMVEANLRLVITMAVKRAKQGGIHGLTLADLIEKGLVGVERAARKFDPELGYRFSTYASSWVRAAMSRALDEARNAEMGVPEHIVELTRTAYGNMALLVKVLERQPDVDELAAELEVSKDEAALVWHYLSETFELDAETGELHYKRVSSRQLPT